FINVTRGLWDCWRDDAVVADLKTGKYFDESQVKPLNHQGPHFSVKGPLNTGRCPQGQPLVLQAGASEKGQNLAARTADAGLSGSYAAPRRPSPIRSKSGSWKAPPAVSV